MRQYNDIVKEVIERRIEFLQIIMKIHPECKSVRLTKHMADYVSIDMSSDVGIANGITMRSEISAIQTALRYSTSHNEIEFTSEEITWK